MSVTPIQSMPPSAPVAPAGFNAAALRLADPATQRTAVAQQFEGILVRQLLGKTMTSMLGGEKGGVAGSVYGDMLADTISQQLSAGRGLGLGRFIEQQLTPPGEKAAPAPSTPASESRPESGAPQS